MKGAAFATIFLAFIVLVAFNKFHLKKNDAAAEQVSEPIGSKLNERQLQISAVPIDMGSEEGRGGFGRGRGRGERGRGRGRGRGGRYGTRYLRRQE